MIENCSFCAVQLDDADEGEMAADVTPVFQTQVLSASKKKRSQVDKSMNGQLISILHYNSYFELA